MYTVILPVLINEFLHLRPVMSDHVLLISNNLMLVLIAFFVHFV